MVHYKINLTLNQCELKVYSRMRPGHKEFIIKDIDVKTFDIDAEIESLRFKVMAPWDNTLT